MIEAHHHLDITEAHHHLAMVDMMIEAHHHLDMGVEEEDMIEDLLLLHIISVEDTVAAADTMIMVIEREEDHLVRQDVGDIDTTDCSEKEWQYM